MSSEPVLAGNVSPGQRDMFSHDGIADQVASHPSADAPCVAAVQESDHTLFHSRFDREES